MRELPAIVLKELRLIRSQRVSLALIIIYPLIVIGSLGLAFGGNVQAQRVNVALFITGETELGNFTADDIVGIIEDTNKANIRLASSVEEAEEFVKTGASDFALVVRKEKTAQGQIVADLLLDNSNFIVAGMFGPIAKAAIQLTSFEISSRMIQQLWDKLLPVRNDLQRELSKIDLYLADLEIAEEKINALQQTMSSISISSLEATLGSQGQNIESTKQVLQQFNSDYSAFKSDIAGTRASLESADAKLNSYHGKVSGQIAVAEQYRDSLVSYEQELDNIANDPSLPPSIKSQVLQLKSSVSHTRQQIDSSIVELRQVKADIEESQQMIASMGQNLNNAEAKLDVEKQTLDSMNLMLDDAAADLSAMNAQLGSLGQTIDDVNRLIVETKATKQDISAKLQNSKAMLQSFMDALGDLGKISPALLSHPIQAFEKELYREVTPLTFITPISLALVLLLTCLLFTTVSVITERREGPHLRMRLSAASPSTLILGKIIGQMLFAFLVSFLILFIGLIGFGVQLQANVLELIAVLAISSFSFIALGLFITNFAKTQSTAILGSLILILPMIFLSGAILPLQLMSPLLQGISSFLPLTAANQLLLGVLIKGLSLQSMSNQVAILLLPAFALLAYSIKRF